MTYQQEEEWIDFVAEIEKRPKDEVRKEMEELKNSMLDIDKDTCMWRKGVTLKILWRAMVLLLRDNYLLATVFEQFRDEYREDQEALGEHLGEVFTNVSKALELAGQSVETKESKEEERKAGTHSSYV